jgi:hypothetical protein
MNKVYKVSVRNVECPSESIENKHFVKADDASNYFWDKYYSISYKMATRSEAWRWLGKSRNKCKIKTPQGYIVLSRTTLKIV